MATGSIQDGEAPEITLAGGKRTEQNPTPTFQLCILRATRVCRRPRALDVNGVQEPPECQ